MARCVPSSVLAPDRCGDLLPRPLSALAVVAMAPQGVDVVYDGVGGATSLESLRCVKFGARYLIVGWASTPNVARGKGQRGAPNANMLPTNLIMMKGLQVRVPGHRYDARSWRAVVGLPRDRRR